MCIRDSEMFHATRALTSEAGLVAYEISNFARPGEECLHNLGYWRNEEYVGLGPGAVSKIDHARGGNPRAIQPYLRRIKDKGVALEWREDPAPAARLGETWWLGLRLLEGVDAARARHISAYTQETDPTAPIQAELLEHDLLERRSDGRLALSGRGLPLADAVAKRFLDTE